MRRAVIGALAVLLVAPACEKSETSTTPEPVEQADTATDEADAEADAAAAAEAEAKAKEEAEKAAAEKRMAERYASLDAAVAAEQARWTDEMRAEAKKLAETKYKDTKKALKKILAGSHRAPGNAERDQYRHPAETLAFFGIKPTMTVVEVGPGAGWYTELLAPLLAAKGKLVIDSPDPNGDRMVGSTFYGVRIKAKLDSSPELYGKVEPHYGSESKPFDIGEAGSADAVLIIRGLHGNARSGSLGDKLAVVHETLKPGGTLGIVQHRAAEGADPMESAKAGYLPQAWLIEQVEAAGFKLEETSEVNANANDTRDYPEGVWTLPPGLALGDKDKDKYVAIGESDRMTLRFKKIPKQAAEGKAGAEENKAAAKDKAEAAGDKGKDKDKDKDKAKAE